MKGQISPGTMIVKRYPDFHFQIIILTTNKQKDFKLNHGISWVST